MNLIEFIGFVISLIAMFILFFSRAIEKRRQRMNPELYETMEHRKKETLKQFLEALDVQHEDVFEEEEDEDEEEVPVRAVQSQPLPQKKAPLYSFAPTVRPIRREEENFQFRSKTDEYKLETAVEKQRLNASLEEKYTPGFLKGRQTDAWAKERGEPDPYALRQGAETSRASKILQKTGSLQDMVILREILGPPKAFDQNDGPYEHF